jgi:hypothetical protein
MRFTGGIKLFFRNSSFASRAPILFGARKNVETFSFFCEKPRMTLIARMALPLFEIALVLVRFDQVASSIVRVRREPI